MLTSILTLYSSCPCDTIHTTGIHIDIVLIPSYCTTSHCHLESFSNNLMKYVDLLTVSYSRLSWLPVSSSPPSSLTSYWSHLIVQLPTVWHFESCTNNLMKHFDLLTATYLWLSLPPVSSSLSSSSISYLLHPTNTIDATSILIHIVLIASHTITSHCLALWELC